MNPFPSGFPAEIAAEAFISGADAAWRALFALQAVKWLGAHDYALLGTELWLVQNGRINSLPVGTSGLPEVHGNTVSRKGIEDWDSYVRRAAAETVIYLQAFNPKDIVEQGELYFNVVWVSELEYGKLSLK